jgi:glyoxylase-like metal-dependent hydrolase (beta-lactamase superfamily II)
MTFKPHRAALLLSSAALALFAGAVPLTTDTSAQTRPTQPAAAGGAAGDVRAVPVQGRISMIIGAGPNLTASVGDQGVLLVDTGEAAASEKVIATIRSLSPRPLQFIINTQFHENHTGGNEALAKFGNRATDGPNAQAVVLAHENVLTRMSGTSGQPSLRPVAAWPTDTYFAKRKELFFNGEAVQVYHTVGQTDGDSIVFFRKSDVISAGDIFNTTSFPVIDAAAGGTINGVIAGLNMIMDLAVPANNAEDGTIIIPGYGRLSDELDVAVYRDMVTIIRDRVQDAVQRKQTLAEVKADKRMTLEYERRYAGKGNWTRDQFLEAIYNTLPKGK